MNLVYRIINAVTSRKAVMKAKLANRKYDVIAFVRVYICNTVSGQIKWVYFLLIG